MTDSLSIEQALLSIPVMACVIFATRFFPFAFFSKRKPPELLEYVGKYLPSLVITVLIVYNLRYLNVFVFPHNIAEIAACLFTVAMHLWKKNAMLSIFGGTILFMILQ
ncbi:MAG: AzlD domain-containing protein [Spirochaetales bacterium]